MTTQTTTCADMIAHLKPCRAALDWAAAYTEPACAWAECGRGDWMLWLIGRSVSGTLCDSAERRKLVGCAARCAALVLPIYERYYPSDSRHCHTNWLLGEVPLER